MATNYATVEITCPRCNEQSWPEIEYLIDSGKVPHTDYTCYCGRTLRIEAVMDISVEVVP